MTRHLERVKPKPARQFAARLWHTSFGCDWFIGIMGRSTKQATLVCAILWLQAAFGTANGQQTATDIAGQAGKADQASWGTLFDGKSLKGWSPTNFGGEGDVEVKAVEPSGTVFLDFGHPLTGITFKGLPDHRLTDLPKIGYEIELEARRVAGSDFFLRPDISV